MTGQDWKAKATEGENVAAAFNSPSHPVVGQLHCVSGGVEHVALDSSARVRESTTVVRRRESALFGKGRKSGGGGRDSVDLPNAETQIVSETLALSPC